MDPARRTAMRIQYAPPPPFLHDTGLEITPVLPLPLGDCFIEGQPQPPVLHGRCPDQGVDVQQYPHLQTFAELRFVTIKKQLTQCPRR